MVSEDLIDELDAIEAIYPECITRLNDTYIELKVPQHEEYKINVTFPPGYPETESPHIIQVRSNDPAQDDQYLEVLFNEVLDSVFRFGSVCIFDLLTELEGVLYVEPSEDSEVKSQSIETETVKVDVLEGWTMSSPIVDRGSTFIAFVRRVDDEDDLLHRLSLLKSEKKISRSHHNMMAFRIQRPDGTRVSDCDDDGETAAGGRLLHLLTLMDVWNLVVVVSRWFGGTHIGPDRFKHINSTAREAIISAGFLDSSNKKKRKK